MTKKDVLWNVLEAKIREGIVECREDHEVSEHVAWASVIWIASYYLFKHSPKCCFQTCQHYSMVWGKTGRWAGLWQVLKWGRG